MNEIDRHRYDVLCVQRKFMQYVCSAGVIHVRDYGGAREVLGDIQPP